MEEKGYIYILTNPSFREDWVKIGKSARPVDVRSKELDNTAVPRLLRYTPPFRRLNMTMWRNISTKPLIG